MSSKAPASLSDDTEINPCDAEIRAPHAMLAELVAHRAFLEIDPSAIHIGGNGAVRDHELAGNKYWCNTKTGWNDRAGILGYAPVNWAKALNPEDVKHSLDLVAVVPLRPTDVKSTLTANGVLFTWAPFDWYLFPASELFKAHIPSASKGRHEVNLEFAEQYLVPAHEKLTYDRLVELAEANDPIIRTHSATR